MYFDKKVLLAKIESAYATDPTPDTTDNVMLVRSLDVNPLELAYEYRDVVRPYFSNEGEIITAKWSSVAFAVGFVGSGAAGTAPKWGPPLRACGFSETIDPGVDVEYAPVSSGFESLAFYFRVDGKQNKVLGWRGNASLRMARGGVPLLMFRGVGLHVQATDTALGTPSFTGWVKPYPVNKANTTTFTLHSYALTPTEFTLDMGNRVAYRDLPNSESVVLTGRRPVGGITSEDVLVATKDWETIIKAETAGALAIVHGPAGSQVKVNAPAVQLTSPRINGDEGILMKSMGLNFKPSSGNDEVVITAL